MARIIGSDTLVPVVSIVIPAKNEAHRIGPTLRSLVNEFDGESVEIVVVNDHSTDETSRIVLSFGGPYAGAEPVATSMVASAPPRAASLTGCRTISGKAPLCVRASLRVEVRFWCCSTPICRLMRPRSEI